MRQTDAVPSDAADGDVGATDATPLLMPADLNSAGEFCTVDGVCVPANGMSGADEEQEAEASDGGANAPGQRVAGDAASRETARHPSSDAERDRG